MLVQDGKTHRDNLWARTLLKKARLRQEVALENRRKGSQNIAQRALPGETGVGLFTLITSPPVWGPSRNRASGIPPASL